MDTQPPGTDVRLDVVTDLVPFVEFEALRLDVDTPDSSDFSDFIVDREADYIRGHRLLNIRLPLGTSRITATLFENGAPVISRLVVVDIRGGAQAVTLVLSRDCRGVECPGAGNASLETCLGGRCVDPRCSPEAREFCPPAVCDRHADCEVPSCATPYCSNVCFAIVDSSQCADGQRCDGTLGCVAEDSGNMDAGIADAGIADAGIADAGIADSSTDISETDGESTCDRGLSSCPGETVCATDIASDINHCGGCGLGCTQRGGASESCSDGSCVYSCDAGLADCDADLSNGCEASVADDVQHCGACDVACGIDESCESGTCVSSCNVDEIMCNDDCIDPLTDPVFCGASDDCEVGTRGTPCVANSVCEAGRCQPCGRGAIACDNVCRIIRLDVNHCGGCDHVCPLTAAPNRVWITHGAGDGEIGVEYGKPRLDDIGN